MTSVPHSGAKSVTPGGSVAGGHTAWFELGGKACPPQNGEPFLAWTITPSYDEDRRRNVLIEEPVVAQVVFGEVCSIPLHYMPQGRRFTHWSPILAPSAAITKATAGETRNAEPIHCRDGDEG